MTLRPHRQAAADAAAAGFFSLSVLEKKIDLTDSREKNK